MNYSSLCSSTGGITMLIDMPLNNFPSTVSEETLKLKVWGFTGFLFISI